MKRIEIVIIVGYVLLGIIGLIIYLDNPPQQKETFTLWVLSDTETDLENLSIAIQDMNNVEWDEALVLGDLIVNSNRCPLTMNNETIKNNTRWEYEQVKKIFEQSNKPLENFHFILGNRDYECKENDACFADGYEILVKDPWYVFDKESLHFIMASTNSCPENIKCNTHANDFIKKNLRLRKINIIATHHPSYELFNFAPLFSFVLLNGHTHHFFDFESSFMSFNKGVLIDSASITNIIVNKTSFSNFNASSSALSRIIIFEVKNIKILTRDSKKHKFIEEINIKQD